MCVIKILDLSQSLAKPSNVCEGSCIEMGCVNVIPCKMVSTLFAVSGVISKKLQIGAIR